MKGLPKDRRKTIPTNSVRKIRSGYNCIKGNETKIIYLPNTNHVGRYSVPNLVVVHQWYVIKI